MIEWEPCPRCGSKKVKQIGSKAKTFLVGLGLISFSIWFILLFPPLGIALAIVGIAMIVTLPFIKKTLKCSDCDNSWKHDKTQRSQVNA